MTKKRTTHLQLRMTQEEKDLLVKRAESRGVSLSEYVRSKLFVKEDDTIRTPTQTEREVIIKILYPKG